MLFPNSSQALENRKSHAKEKQLILHSPIRQSKHLLSFWLKRLISGWSIAKKINYGYSLAIGIGVLGTTIGLVVGDYCQKQAERQRLIADTQQHLIMELKNAVLEVRSHPQRLLTVLGDSIWFSYESAKFYEDINRIENILSVIENFVDKYPDNLAVNAADFKQILKAYQNNSRNYKELIESLWQRLEPSSLKAEEIPAAQNFILMSAKEKKAIEISIEFELLSERLKRIMLTAETQNKQANAALKQAEALRIGFITVSILLSTAIAIAIGLYTTRAITHPILSLSKVAQQITQQSNFNLTAPIFSQDEIGLLADSINQLVAWVKKYTQELEQARQNLEQRVEERTQELNRTIQELKQAQAQLIQSEKMSSLGQLVSGIAHEINNPVSFIYGNVEHANQYMKDFLDLLQLYQQYYPHPEKPIQEKMEEIEVEFLIQDMPKLLSSIKIGAERIRKIVLSLRNFSRLDESELKAVDIREGIENTLLILNSRLNHHLNQKTIKVIKNYGEIPLLECYPAQLNQVFMNIINNAIDALEYSDNGNGKLEKMPTIVISVQKIDSDRIRIAIWNNGPPIPAEIIDKVFDPFFTTKPVGKGTGLGLYICYQIIEKHGGKIEVSSDAKQGTEFAVILPVKQKVTY